MAVFPDPPTPLKPILGMGTVVVDHQVFLRRLPDPDTKEEIRVDRIQVGGAVVTALAQLGRFGLKTSFIGRWSTDRNGEIIEEDLARWGVASGLAVVLPEGRSGFAHVWVEEGSGRRSIAAFRGSHQVMESDLDGIDWTGFSALHLDGWSTDAAIAASRRMRDAGGRVFLDLGSPKPRLAELLAHVDVVNGPRRLFEGLYPGESLESAAEHFLQLGVSQVTVTDGEKGAWMVRPLRVIHQPAYAVEAADTNGAGDVFFGALVYASLCSFSDSDCLRFAAGAAALKCRSVGNREALPTLEQIGAFWEGDPR